MSEENKMNSLITRRSFMKGAVYGTMGFVFGSNRFKKLGGSDPGQKPFDSDNPTSRLVLVRRRNAVDKKHKINADIVGEMIDTALQQLSGEIDSLSAWKKFVEPDDTVGIKFTRCSWMRVYTEEKVVETIQTKLKKIGIPRSRIHAKDGGLPVEKCTTLINVPSIKVHTLTGIAVSIKNYINFSSEPSSYHHQKSVNLGEIWMRPEVKGKTRLIIVDALRPYFGPGPQLNPLHRWDYKGIIMGTDPVAIDTVCLKICQEKRNLFKGEEWPITPPPLSVIAADRQYNLGTSDPSKIKLVRVGWDEEILI